MLGLQRRTAAAILYIAVTHKFPVSCFPSLAAVIELAFVIDSGNVSSNREPELRLAKARSHAATVSHHRRRMTNQASATTGTRQSIQKPVSTSSTRKQTADRKTRRYHVAARPPIATSKSCGVGGCRSLCSFGGNSDPFAATALGQVSARINQCLRFLEESWLPTTYAGTPS